MNGGVHWVDLQQPENNRNVAHHQKGVFAICRVKDSVFTVGGDGMLTRWSTDPFRTVESLQLTNQSLRSIDYHAGRNELAVGGSDNAIYLLDAATLQIKRQLPDAHENSVFTVRYTADGRRLLSGGRDAHLKGWDLEEDCETIFSEPAHWFTINDIVFHPNGLWFATASRDKSIKIWDADSFRLLKVLEGVRDGGHFNSVNRLFWSAHEGQLISGSDDRSMIIWRVSQES
jgi:WD40 repeat protein